MSIVFFTIHYGSCCIDSASSPPSDTSSALSQIPEYQDYCLPFGNPATTPQTPNHTQQKRREKERKRKEKRKKEGQKERKQERKKKAVDSSCTAQLTSRLPHCVAHHLRVRARWQRRNHPRACATEKCSVKKREAGGSGSHTGT